MHVTQVYLFFASLGGGDLCMIPSGPSKSGCLMHDAGPKQCRSSTTESKQVRFHLRFEQTLKNSPRMKHLQDPLANTDRKSYKETKRLGNPLRTLSFLLSLSLIPCSLSFENSREAALSDGHPSVHKRCRFSGPSTVSLKWTWEWNALGRHNFR